MRPNTPDLYAALVTDANAALATGVRNAVVFSPDGHTLTSGGEDRTIRLGETDVDRAIQRICAITANTLTPAMWERYVSPTVPYHPPCP
jgi:WD40 repeat protein